MLHHLPRRFQLEGWDWCVTDDVFKLLHELDTPEDRACIYANFAITPADRVRLDQYMAARRAALARNSY